MAPSLLYTKFRDSLGSIPPENFDLDAFMNQLSSNVANASKNEPIVEKLFLFAKSNGKLKVNSTVIPTSVLPAGVRGELFDVKIGGRGPDDKVYSHNSEIREQITRGMTFMELEEDKLKSLDLVTYANKKFTGGVGDEDEFQPENDDEWRKFCIEPPEDSAGIVCTMKLNGEAAHISGRYIEDQFFIFAGSKNVHMMFKNEEEIDLYNDSKFNVAQKVAKCVWHFYSSMDEEKRYIFEMLLHHTKVTLVCEMLQPDYQHIVNLSSYSESTLGLVSIAASVAMTVSNLNAFYPAYSLTLGQFLGMFTSEFQVLSLDEVPAKIKEIRKRYRCEGCVLYYVSDDGRTTGVAKVKTIWYTLLRALREKAVYTFTAAIKKKDFSLDARISSATKRFNEIQTWLKFSDDILKQWKDLAESFLKWLNDEINQGQLLATSLRPNFPLIWEKFLESTSKNDNLLVA